jgi:hypothetical protein
MNTHVVRPEVGQWYAHLDKGEMFRVVGHDERSRTIEMQSFDGDLDEIDADTWYTLPLERSEPPEDWTGPIDDVEADDLGYSETAMQPADWTRPLQALRAESEAWQDAQPEEERDPLAEGEPREPFSADLAEAEGRAQ